MVLGTSRMHTLALHVLLVPLSQFKPDDYVHHVSEGIIPPSPRSSRTSIIVRVIMRLESRGTAGRMRKRCLLRLSSPFDVLLRWKM